MLHPTATPGLSHGSISTPSDTPQTKSLPHIGTMLKQSAVVHQAQRPSAAETIIQTIAAAVEDTSGAKNHSRNILGLFSRSKDDARTDFSLGRSSTSNALRSNSDRAKRTTHLNKGQIRDDREGSLPFTKAVAKMVKQITLAVPTMDADSLLRLAHSRQDTQRFSLDGNDSNDPKRRVLEDAPIYWTTSTFVLTNDGMLYQYPATGSSRRLPDRFIQINKDSAAFASDVLPGKHWVLRITQTFGQTPTTPASKSRFSKLGLRSAKEETINNILLVMESAEEMNSWQTAVKDVIASQTVKVSKISRKSSRAPSIIAHELATEYTPRASLQKDTQSLRRAVSAMQLSNGPSRTPSTAKRHASATAVVAELPSERSDEQFKATTVATATEDLSRLVLQLDRDGSSSDSSPIQEDSEDDLPKWDLPVSIGPGLSLASPMMISFPKSHQRNSSEDFGLPNRFSTSMASVGTRQSGVPSLSYRFSQSTRAGTIIDTPSHSTRSSMCAPPPSQHTKDLLGRRGAGALPFILTDSGTREANEAHEVHVTDDNSNYQGPSVSTEEAVSSPLDMAPKIPKRYSSLSLSKPEDWEDVGDSKETYPPMLNPRKRLSSLIPDGSALILSPRALSITNPGSARIVSTTKKFVATSSQMSSPVSSPYTAELPGSPVPITSETCMSLIDAQMIVEEKIQSSKLGIQLNPVSKVAGIHAIHPASAPPTQLSFGIASPPMSPVVSRFNTSFRSSSSQGSSSIHHLNNKPSLMSLVQTSAPKSVTLREKRSVPNHLLGPPAPPPTRSLPAVPGSSVAVLSC